MPVQPKQLRLIYYPDPILQQQAGPIEDVTEEVREVVRRMGEMMHEEGGVGLAGPQVGLGWRVFVANPTGTPGEDRVYINPVLRDPSTETESEEEGCLSIPEVSAPIVRPGSITIEATDLEGRRFTQVADQRLARIWQHETDHLNGVLILNRMRPMDRLANRRAIKALKDRYGG